MKLSKESTALLLASANEAATPYNALAAAIATITTRAKATAETAKGERKGLWAEFRKGLTVAHDNGHTATQLRVGLEMACANANVPAGTIRSYVGTVANMHADVQAGKLSAEDAAKLSITDARKLYPADKAKAERKEAEAAMIAAVSGWTLDEIRTWTADVIAARATTEAQAKAA